MAKTAYSKQQLQDIMTEVTAAVDEILVKSEAPIATVKKNENCAPVVKSDVQDAQDKKAQGGQMSKAGEDPSSPAPDASASAPAPAPDASASAPASPSPDASAPAPAPSADPAAAAGAPSQEELVSAYAQLSPDELQAHMAALQQVLAQQQSAAPAPGGAPAPQASASPAAPAPGPDATAPMPGDQSQGVSPEFAMKHEKLQAQVADLQKNLSLATEALTMVLAQPKMKSISGEDLVMKNEPSFNVEGLSKSEFTERLNKAVRSESLSKSDRDLVKGFYKGEKQRRDIAHLIK